MLPLLSSSDEPALRRLLDRTPDDHRRLESAVRKIVSAVRTGGDEALVDFAWRFDWAKGGEAPLQAKGGHGGPPLHRKVGDGGGASLHRKVGDGRGDHRGSALELSADEIVAGAAEAPRAVRAAIRKAARHIRIVARAQVPPSWTREIAPGVTVEQRVTPLARVGCYVPGGRYPLPSSLLMTAVTARAAGVPEVVVVCPRPGPAVLAAALEARVDRVFRVGGAHAIAALAYGTSTVPRVDKIVGPGNAYVALAKAMVARDCAIDFFAGPSEIVVVARAGRAEWIAADLLAQAEHDVDARAILITPSRRLAAQVARELGRQAPADGPAREALARNGAIIVTKTIAEAAQLANRIAPEHLVVDAEDAARMIPVAGAVFIGEWTAQAAGDYAIGSNHVLPTSGAARFRGGLHAWDFVRVSSVQRLTKRGIGLVGPTAATLADAEGLALHAASIRRRLEAL